MYNTWSNRAELYTLCHLVGYFDIITLRGVLGQNVKTTLYRQLYCIAINTLWGQIGRMINLL